MCILHNVLHHRSWSMARGHVIRILFSLWETGLDHAPPWPLPCSSILHSDSFILVNHFINHGHACTDSLPVISRLKEVTQVCSTRPERSWERDTSEDSQKRST